MESTRQRSFNGDISPRLSDLDNAIIRQLAEEYFGSLAAMEDGNLEGLDMTDTRPNDHELVDVGEWYSEGGRCSG